MRLWCYLCEWFVKANNPIARDTYQLQSQTPSFKATGTITDISNVCKSEWYQWVYFRDHASSFPHTTKERFGRCLGTYTHSGTMMSMHIMNDNGTVLPFQTILALTHSEINSSLELDKKSVQQDYS